MKIPIIGLGKSLEKQTITERFEPYAVQYASVNPIKGFKDEYAFLSNFYPCSIEYEGVVYHSVENAYQAAKFLQSQRDKFVTCTASKAKFYGKGILLQDRENIMFNLLTKKFSHAKLAKMLLDTGDMDLIEWNTWGDTFWGICSKTMKGQNRLGVLLMNVRRNLQSMREVHNGEETS